MMMSLFNSLFLWTIIFFMIIVIIYLLRIVTDLYRSNILQGILKNYAYGENNIDTLSNPSIEMVYLFLTFTDNQNSFYLEQIEKMLSNESELYLIYVGPRWKANLLSSKVKGKFNIMLDEKGHVATQLGINQYPSFVRMDSNFRIIELRTMNIGK